MSLIKTQSKILTLSELAAKARAFRAGGLIVVQAHGTFDLLHLDMSGIWKRPAPLATCWS